MDIDNEILMDFQNEARTLHGELENIISELEEIHDQFPKELLEDFANRTDRMMGTANTFNEMYPGHAVFQQISRFCELCKVTGYKASTLNNIELVPIFAAFWADTLDILDEIIDNLDNAEQINEVTKNFMPTLQKRLLWLTQQIVKITKETSNNEEAKINVDGLLRKLGFDV